MNDAKNKAIKAKSGLKHLSPKELKGFSEKKDTPESLAAILHTRKGYYKEDVAKGGKYYRKN